MADKATTTEEEAAVSTEETTTETTEASTEESAVDWKSQSRKHEREAKKARAEREALAAKLQEREDADKSEHDKAIEAAREEGKTAAETESTQKFRDKLLKAEVRAQAAGKFANPALAIKLLDLDHDTIFDDDGEIDAAAITKAVDDFLEQEPGLKAGGTRPGSADAGKGTAGKSREDMTVEDHLAEISRSKK